MGVLVFRVQVLVTVYETKPFLICLQNMQFFTYKYCTYYFLLCLSGIRKYRKGSRLSSCQSWCQAAIHLSVCCRTFLHDGLMDFLHIGYHDQVPSAADVCKIKFGSALNLSNYDNFFINFELCDISEKSVLILVIFGTGIRYHALLMLVK